MRLVLFCIAELLREGTAFTENGPFPVDYVDGDDEEEGDDDFGFSLAIFKEGKGRRGKGRTYREW